METIRRQLKECSAVISLITEEYLKSTFCLVEMGAAWAMSKQYFPLLTVSFERLNGTPLQSVEMRRLFSAEDLSVIYDELHMCGVLEGYQTAQFHRRVTGFVQTAQLVDQGKFVIEKDADGYYEAVIFPDLQEGDRVKFKTTKSEIKYFKGLGKVRNIYPDDLKKIE